MAKELKFDIEARELLLKGVGLVAQAVGSTLGPKANNVAIDRDFGTPIVLHDGVRVAQEIKLKNKFENLGASIVIEAAQKTNDMAGDGTTTATILAQAIAEASHKNITAGSNAQMLKKGIETAVEVVVKNLKKMSKEIKTPEEIEQVATISAQDKSIGKMIRGAYDKLGNDCIITVEEGGLTTEIDYKEGMEFDQGYTMPHFITKPETNESIIENPYILIVDGKVEDANEFLGFAEKFKKIQENEKIGNNFIVIADEVTGMPLQSIVVSKIKGISNCSIIKAPGFGTQKQDLLEDIALITGGKVISRETGGRLDEIEAEDFGHAKRVVSSKDNTLIIDGAGEKAIIDQRIEQISDQIEKSDSEFEIEKMKERRAKLSSGIAVISVGANSEVEMREKKERCIDAINATRAAIEEGIVPGGEVALINAGADLEVLQAEGDKKIGIKIVSEAIEKPFLKLMDNSGFNSGKMLERLSETEENKGIDVMDGKIKDMVKIGIIDPVKVTRLALQNAASSAIMLMTTNTLIVPIKEDKKEGE